MSTKAMIISALFAAIICIFSVMTIPIGAVPVTMSTFGIMLSAIILGPKKSMISVAIFILIGAIGIPVFSGFRSGLQTLLGPTGGYIWSYIPMALVIGIFTNKLPSKKLIALIKIFTACIIGIILCYAFGTVQFTLIQQIEIIKALTVCVIPFIPFDIVKALLAAYVGYYVSSALKKTGYFKND